MRFFEENYSSEMMCAALFGNIKINELEWIASKYISQIPMRNELNIFSNDNTF